MTGEREIQLILAGAEWLRTTPKEQRPRPSIVELRERFGLNARAALEAVRMATDFNKLEACNDNAEA
ncbi:MAG: hypothetical protein EOS22_01030 [Mesorhizobium sp.]|uniref:hypothetical protein n=1 Tax=Mesorhizobium sp. TaxID=1871066 RepID=UPI000FE5020B|nr:hypothetical protein [Mesorhizobium sp.]RWD33362.1 MAG: hypothetical protein EOS22_01030 [Mesorhizobium sp.]TJW69297.1 MAG: hypothetical protein E5V29_07980 [Mesorhizobium sp.]